MSVLLPKLGDPSEYRLRIFNEKNYSRRICKVCETPFWTKGSSDICNDIPCTDYRFFDIPLKLKNLSYEDTVRLFLEFFKREGHTIVDPAPVVARWREDLYLTIASIVVFQPHVTSGRVPPPANPLVIAQPCIRLEDIDNVGLTFGRHMTSFIMGGHHAFNYPDRFIYWKDKTVEYAEKFFGDLIGVPEDELTFKESWWEGGGNAGPSMEVTVGGLEVATLVFMQYSTTENGYKEIPLKIVDVGYGIERITWLVNKTPTAFHAVYGRDLVDKFFDKLGVSKPDEELLRTASIYSGRIDPDSPQSFTDFIDRVSRDLGRNKIDVESSIRDIINVFAVLDHTRTLSLMLGDGIVPSNTGEGYLARLVLRRIMRNLARIGSDVSLRDLMKLQISRWGDFFKSISRNSSYILEVVDSEEERYKENIRRAPSIVRRYARGGLDLKDLIEIYDSHGIPPEIVSDIASSNGISIEIPRNFYSIVASRHSRAPIKKREEVPEELVKWVSSFNSTRRIFHEDPMAKYCEGRIIGVNKDLIVLDQTCLYPLGGGQRSDEGFIEIDGDRYRVLNVLMIGDVILHRVDRALSEDLVGRRVRIVVDWEKRYRTMRHHTATHILLGALRRVLGDHVWQAGADKNEFRGRLDVTHYKMPDPIEVKKIEELVNRIIDERRPIKASIMNRYEAEKLYGFSIYQGGVPQDPMIRIVEIEGWDAQACFGTHLPHTGEVGGFKITSVSKIADGVIRFEYVAGSRVAEEASRFESILRDVSSIIGGSADESIVSRARSYAESFRNLQNTLSRYRILWIENLERLFEESEIIGEVKLFVVRDPPEEDVARDFVRRITSRGGVVSVIVSGGGEGSRVEISLSGDLLDRFDASVMIRRLAEIFGGRGGGKKDHSQGVVKADPEKIIRSLKELLRSL
ncbi:MAG: alanine--tRNA ligase [Sulfolobales archaeon]